MLSIDGTMTYWKQMLNLPFIPGEDIFFDIQWYAIKLEKISIRKSVMVNLALNMSTIYYLHVLCTKRDSIESIKSDILFIHSCLLKSIFHLKYMLFVINLY